MLYAKRNHGKHWARPTSTVTDASTGGEVQAECLTSCRSWEAYQTHH